MVQQRTSGMAIASLVCGILGIIPFMGFLLSLLAIIFGGVGISQTGRDAYLSGRGMAITGLVLGIVIPILWIILFIVLGVTFWSWIDTTPYYYY